MKRAKLNGLSTERLVEEFGTLAAEHIRAIIQGPLGDANRTYERLVAIRGELRKRGLEAQRQLLPLLSAPDVGTRFWAAASVLTFAPQEAEQVLTELESTQRNSLGFKAGLMLQQWREGTFNPP